MNIYGNYGGGYGVPPFMQNPFYGSASPENNRSDSAMVFVALMPLFTLFLEGGTGSIIAAAIFWAFSYLLGVILCKRDYKRYVRPIEFNNFNLSKTVYIPVLYLIKRQKVFPSSKQLGYLSAFILFFAIIQCGFFQLFIFSSNECIRTVANSSCAMISEVKDDPDVMQNTTIDKAISLYSSSNAAGWNCTRESIGNYNLSVLFDGYYNGEKSEIKIDFAFHYDQYSFDGLFVTGVFVDGKELSDADGKALLMNIFTTRASDSGSTGGEKNYVEV